jgi:hypothetical protein
MSISPAITQSSFQEVDSSQWLLHRSIKARGGLGLTGGGTASAGHTVATDGGSVGRPLSRYIANQPVASAT